MMNWLKYLGHIDLENRKPINEIELRIVVANTTVNMHITDLMLQEGPIISGYIPHTAETLVKKVDPPKFYNLPVRGRQSFIVLNKGKATTGLNVRLSSKDEIESGNVILSSMHRAKQLMLRAPLNVNDVVIMKYNPPFVQLNNSPAPYRGGLPVCPPWDSKFHIDLNAERQKAKAMNLLVTIQEHDLGEGGEKV